ncbi:MAG: N-succinylarginine dihydrolase [Phycisphaeraceae bacterium]
MGTYEVNFDGLIGPTHNYAGLSRGNLASTSHKGHTSNPKQAALQGLAKMKLLAELGVKQAILPPQVRPDIQFLRRLGFMGTDAQVIEKCAADAPQLLATAYSASSMWTANAATVSPSFDTNDRRVHITPANLISQLHRSLEAKSTHSVLRKVFANEKHFALHEPLPAAMHLSDEGAANHTRLCATHGEPGIELFTFGRVAGRTEAAPATKFPARQSREACESIARLHGLGARQAIFVQQSPEAINAGVFHNDVIAVGNGNVLLCHDQAWVDMPGQLATISTAFERLTDQPLVVIEVKTSQVSLDDAVRSYLFNSQIVTLPDGSMAIICPIEAMEYDSTRQFLDALLTMNTPIRSRHVVDLRQSMNNGGGPACVRLRVALTEKELNAVNPRALWTPARHDWLVAHIERTYRDELSPEDLADPAFIEESRAAAAALVGMLEDE